MLPIVRKAWPIGLLYGFFGLWNMMEISIFAPFLYSRVQCCGLHGNLDSKYDIEAPSMIDDIQKEAASLGLVMPLVDDTRILACAIPNFPPHSKMWSGSLGCVNPDFVKDSSQDIISISMPLQTIALLLLLPVGGAIADACGRRPVILTYGIMCMLACVIYMLDAVYCHMWGNVMLFLAGILICPVHGPKDMVCVSSISDLTLRIEGDGLSDRSSALSLLFACGTVASLVGTGLAYMVTSLHVSIYFWPWLACSCMAIGIVIFTQLFFTETLPKDQLIGLKRQMFNPFQTQLQALSLMWHNKMLLVLMATNMLNVIAFVGYASQHVSYLTKHGFSQNEAILPTLVNFVCGITTSCLVSRYGDYLHLIHRVILACLLDVLGYLLLGPLFAGPLFAVIGHVAPYLGFGVCLGIARALLIPSTQALISAHVGVGDQAKCQSAVGWFCNLGSLIGSLVWGNCLYDATATGLGEIMPVLGSLALTVVSTILAFGMGIYENIEGQIRDTEPAKSLLLSGPTSYGTDTPTSYGTETSFESSSVQACKES